MSLIYKLLRALDVKPEIKNRQFKWEKSIIPGKCILPFLTTLALLSPCSAWGFTLNSSDGKIEFSVRPVELPSQNREYDPTTTSTSVEDGLLTPGEDGLLTPDEGYPEISLEIPTFPIQTKEGSLDPLSDVWNDPRGIANITVQTVTLPTLAAIVWDGEDVFLDDLVADQSAARNASFGSAEFTTTISGFYREFAFLNVSGEIDLNQEDAWVTGSIIAHFGGAAAPHTLEILFGFDGLNSDGTNRGREDFIKAYLDGELNPETFTGEFLVTGANTFTAQGLLLNRELFLLNRGENVTIEGTFSCVGFNGHCSDERTVSFSFAPSLAPPESIPEPTSTLGLLAFGIFGVASILKHQPRKGSS
jgi:hypothetical protein